MAYRNKTYVAFDADSDIHYYRLMQAWKQSDNTTFNFHNAHELNKLMPWSSEETIKDKLRERFQDTKMFILLIGEKTKFLYKFVKWEIEQALKRNLPIIAVNLNGKRSIDYDQCPLILKEELAIHVSFNPKIIQYSLENWEESYKNYLTQQKNGPFYYKETLYSDLGL